MLKRSFAIILLALLIMGSPNLWASDSLSYSGRLVNADGSPVTSTVNLKFELAYTSPVGVGPAVCSQQLTNVQLSNGVFHVKLDPDCSPLNLTTFLAQTPAGESVAIRVTDESAGKTYSYQALYSIPFAQVSKQLSQMGANTNDVLQWDGGQWIPASLGSIAGVGTVTQVDTGTGLTGGPITGTGTISIANGGVNTAQLADGAVTDLKVATGIARTKLANGTPNYVLMNNGSGVISEVSQVPLAQGGTGAANAADARTNLGLGLAAVLNTGMGSTNVLIGGDVQSCLAHQKLQWNLAPVMGWSCVNDNDSLDTTKLPLAGGTMTGAIDMGSNAIVNLPGPTNPTDAANMAYVDAQVGAMNSSQWTTAGSDIYYDGGNVGIGTNAPNARLVLSKNASMIQAPLTDTNLQIAGADASTNRVLVDSYGGAPVLTFRRANGSATTPSAVVLDDILGSINMIGYGATAYGGSNRASITFKAAENWTNATQGTHLVFSTTATGTITNTERMRIDASGNVGIGLTNPSQKLDVNGNIAVSGIVRIKSDNANYVELRAPTSLASTLSFIFPGSLGTAGQALITDGAGNLSWSSVATSASTVGGDLNGTITNAQINSSAVGSTEIADLSIVDADIANNTISYGKLNLADASIPQAKVNGLTTALSGKEPTIAAGDSTQFWRGDKTWQTLNTTAVPEGTNLYFLESRVRDALMTGYAAGSALSLAPTDSLLQALGKLEGQIIANKAAFDGTGQWNKNGTSVYYNGGNVGIGTTTPLDKLAVIGSVSNANYGNMIARFNDGTGVYKGIRFSTPAVVPGAYNGAFEIATDTLPGSGEATFVTRIKTPDSGSGRTRHDLIVDGNVGVGTTIPSTKFEILGDADQATPLIVNRNSAQNSNMMFKNTDGSIYVGMSGTENFGIGPNIDLGHSSTYLTVLQPSGNLGVGTNTPTSKLSVVSATDSAWAAQVVNNGTTNAHGLMAQVGASSTGVPFGVYKGATELFRVSNAGNVGIGTTTPTHKLEIVSASGGSLKFDGFTAGSAFTSLMSGSDFGSYIKASNNGQLVLALQDNDNSDGFRIISGGGNYMADSIYDTPVFTAIASGNVGIGTASPSTPLHVSTALGTTSLFQSSNTSYTNVQLNNTSSSKTWNLLTVGSLAGAYGAAGSFTIDEASGGPRLTIASGGNVGIGTIAPTTKLHVAGGVSFNNTYAGASNAKMYTNGAYGQVEILNDTSNVDLAYLALHSSNNIAWQHGMIGSTYVISNTAGVGKTYNDVERFSITNTGNVGIGTTAPGYKLDVNGTIRGFGITDSSDIRLKKDIQELNPEETLRKILQLQGVSYLWRDPEHNQKRQIGFIAQEMEMIFPELVETDAQGMKSVNYSHLVSPMVSAIKALNERHNREIASVKEENAKLKTENEMIKAYICSKDPKAVFCLD